VGDLRYLTREPIDMAALLAEVSAPERGGAVAFLGTVRRGPDDGPVTAIEYTAYEAMVVTELDRIIEEARAKWPEAGFAARHRLGAVPTGEASIGIVAAAPHRAQAFEAGRFLIEEAKRRLPVWKRERFDDGTAQWRDA
jgi:molybdopterin synthase catalytic subunit